MAKCNRKKLEKITVANYLGRKTGYRTAVKYVKIPMEAFQLFFCYEMIEEIVKLKNAVFETAIQRFPAVLAKPDNYTCFWVVGSNKIKAYIRIIYLELLLVCIYWIDQQFGSMDVHIIYFVQQCRNALTLLVHL